MTTTLNDLSLYSETEVRGVKVGDILVLLDIEYLIVSNSHNVVFLANLKTGGPWACSCEISDRNAYIPKQVLKNILGSKQHDFENIEVILSEVNNEQH